MSDELNATDGVSAGDGGGAATRLARVRRWVVGVVLVACVLAVVGSWVLPQERWTPWWPPLVTPVAAYFAVDLATRGAASRRRAPAVLAFGAAALVGWAGEFAAWRGAPGLADALEGAAMIGLAAGWVISWPLHGLPMPSGVRAWWVRRRRAAAVAGGE